MALLRLAPTSAVISSSPSFLTPAAPQPSTPLVPGVSWNVTFPGRPFLPTLSKDTSPLLFLVLPNPHLPASLPYPTGHKSFWLIHCHLPLKCKLHLGRDVCLSCSLRQPQHLVKGGRNVRRRQKQHQRSLTCPEPKPQLLSATAPPQSARHLSPLPTLPLQTELSLCALHHQSTLHPAAARNFLKYNTTCHHLQGSLVSKVWLTRPTALSLDTFPGFLSPLYLRTYCSLYLEELLSWLPGKLLLIP